MDRIQESSSYDEWFQQLLNAGLDAEVVVPVLMSAFSDGHRLLDLRTVRTIMHIGTSLNEIRMHLNEIKNGDALRKAGYEPLAGLTSLPFAMSDKDYELWDKVSVLVQQLRDLMGCLFFDGFMVGPAWVMVVRDPELGAEHGTLLQEIINFFLEIEQNLDNLKRLHHNRTVHHARAFLEQLLEYHPCPFDFENLIRFVEVCGADDCLRDWATNWKKRPVEVTQRYWTEVEINYFGTERSVEERRSHLAARICRFGIEGEDQLVLHYVKRRAHLYHEASDLRHDLEHATAREQRGEVVDRIKILHRLDAIRREMESIPLP